MANEIISDLEDQFKQATIKTRKAYDLLNAFGVGGLEQDYQIAKRDYEKTKGQNTSFAKNNAERYNRLKPKYEAAVRAYADAQKEKNALNKRLKDAKKTAEETKTKEITSKSAKNVYDKKIDALKSAEEQLAIGGYQADTKYQSAWREAETAYANAVTAGLKPIPLGTPRIVVPPVVVDTGTDDGKVDPTKKESENLGAFISTLADPKNTTIVKAVQEDLARNFGYKGPIDGLYSLPLQNAINTIAGQRQSLPATLQGTDFRTFIADDKSSQLLGISATGATGGSGGTSISNYISDATQAAATVNTVMQDLLKRDATPKEIADLSKILIDAQKKNPYKTTNGIRTGGINDAQLLTQVIQSGKYAADKKLGKLSTLGKLAQEFTTKKTDKRTILGEDIMATANANGISLTPAQLQTYSQQVENGTDINIIKRAIRSSAALGLPDNIQKLIAEGTDLETIFSPYRNAMASILEINPDSISLTDPTLRKAFGPDKEIPLYEFQRQLRKDARWQYTNNAREEVSNSALGVLRDFGFQG